MSFRHTAITEFLYKHDKQEELDAIKAALKEYGYFEWRGSSNDPQLGYFHGVIKDFDSCSTKEQEHDILQALKSLGVDMKIVYES